MKKNLRDEKKKNSPTVIRTQDTGFKVQGDNHFTIREKAFLLLTATAILCFINIQNKLHGCDWLMEPQRYFF